MLDAVILSLLANGYMNVITIIDCDWCLVTGPLLDQVFPRLVKQDCCVTALSLLDYVCVLCLIANALQD